MYFKYYLHPKSCGGYLPKGVANYLYEIERGLKLDQVGKERARTLLVKKRDRVKKQKEEVRAESEGPENRVITVKGSGLKPTERKTEKKKKCAILAMNIITWPRIVIKGRAIIISS